MKLTSKNKEALLKEIKFAAKKMAETEDPKGKLYYFSAVYAIMQRIFNLEFDPELVFIHMVLNTTYSVLQDRLATIESGAEKVVKIPENLFDKLTEATKEIAKKIENNESSYEVLQKFVILGYVVSGNGYYLYEKGMLKI